MKILIVEDNHEIANLVRIFLEKEGYEIVWAQDGQEGYDILTIEKIDLCIFDIMLPKIDGFSLIQKVRVFSNIPIIMLSAKNSEQDKILGLDLGADDYITKPFSSLELVSRVNANIRRNYKMNKASEVIVFNELKIDTEKCLVMKDDKDCNLTAMEYKLLLKFITSPERVFTKKQLYEAVCGEYIEGDEYTITVHISRLREKIENDTKNPEYIKTIRGLGYKIAKK